MARLYKKKYATMSHTVSIMSPKLPKLQLFFVFSNFRVSMPKCAKKYLNYCYSKCYPYKTTLTPSNTA